jgi:hypothetical protein
MFGNAILQYFDRAASDHPAACLAIEPDEIRLLPGDLA